MKPVRKTITSPAAAVANNVAFAGTAPVPELTTNAMKKHMNPRMALAAGFVIAALAAAPAAQAAIIWDNVITYVAGTNNPVSTDVNIEGVTILAVQQNGAGAGNTVNGVVFTNTTTQNNVTFERTTGLSSTFDGFVSSGVLVDGTTDPTPYRSLLMGAWYGSNPATFTLSGLTPNQEYLVQVWTSDIRVGLGGNAYNYLTMNGTDNTNPPQMLFYNNGTGSTVVGRFTATGTSVSFNQDATGSHNQYGQVNAIQLRAIPEPTSSGLLGAAAVGMLLRRRVRR